MILKKGFSCFIAVGLFIFRFWECKKLSTGLKNKYFFLSLWKNDDFHKSALIFTIILIFWYRKLFTWYFRSAFFFSNFLYIESYGQKTAYDLGKTVKFLAFSTTFNLFFFEVFFLITYYNRQKNLKLSRIVKISTIHILYKFKSCFFQIFKFLRTLKMLVYVFTQTTRKQKGETIY